MLHFDALKIYSCEKHCNKKRNRLEQAIYHFLTMFSTVYGNFFFILTHSHTMTPFDAPGKRAF